MGKFNKGLLFGGALGAGIMWLMTTTKGKKVREQMLDYAADAYTKLRDEILASESYDKLTKSRYAQLVRDFVETYANKYQLTDEVKQMVMKLVSTQWKRLREELKKR